MSQQAQLPDEQKFNAFASKLKDFRETLPKDEQPMLDAMVAAAFQQEDRPADNDVQGYWWAARGPYGGMAVGGNPGWYGAPVYAATPWAAYYGYGYPVYYP
jgi:hypothetical protein